MQISRRSFGLFAAGLAACAHRPPDSTSVIGDWRGQWRKGDQAIDALMRFEQMEGAYSGSFDSEDLRVAGIPFSSVAVSGANVSVELRGDASSTTFEGAVAGDVFEGALREGEQSGSFSLHRVLDPPPRPLVEAVRFRNGEIELAGEIVTAGSATSRPAIVFLHGSQAEGRWASRYLAHRFAERGFAALIFDKRGVGESRGDWRTAGFDDLANDGVAAFAALAAHRGVAPHRIGVFGHSQGGSIAPLVAQRAQAKFAIGSAAAGVSPAECENYSVSNAIGVSALSGGDRADAEAFVRQIVAVGYEGRPYDELTRMAARFRDRSWFFEPPPADDYYWSFARRIAAFDPVAAWSRVRAPALLLYGSNDERVPAVPSAEAISGVLRQASAPVTVRMYEGADHTFRLPARQGGWPRSAPGYVDDMLAWAASAA
jgi:alpha-beta hydrolase superfamily lysophospholipase